MLPASIQDMSSLVHFAQPPHNNPDSVLNALTALASAHDDRSCRAAYNEMLYAVGNSHAGTYYPVVLGLLPFWKSLVSSGNVWTQHCVLEVLIDLCGSFTPEPGYECFNAQSVTSLLLSEVHEWLSLVSDIAKNAGISQPSAATLLDTLQNCKKAGYTR